MHKNSKRALDVTVILLSLLACGTQGDDFWHQQRRAGQGLDSRPIAEVLHEDLADIDDLADVRSAADPCVSRAFGQFFGGHDGRAVRKYIDARLQHYFTSDDLRDATIAPDPTSLLCQGWWSVPKSSDSGQAKKARPEPEACLGAQNIGAMGWMHAVINRTPLTLCVSGKKIPLDSPRAGVMLIGEAYRQSSFKDDLFIDVGPLSRQQILVHEARHSDCTGGFWKSDWELGRKAASHDEFLAEMSNIGCLHLHVPCKDGPLEGLLACDSHPWGSYAAGLVFLEGTIADLDPYTSDAVMARATLMDARSRLTFSAERMLAGELGAPDMSHVTDIVP